MSKPDDVAIRPARATSDDVARLAGVSRSAVSRCFSGNGYVSPDVRARVRDAAERLGYRPNAIARSLTGQRSHLVGVIAPRHSSVQTDRELRALVTHLADVGKRAMVTPVAGEEELAESLLRALDYQVDAIVVLSGTVPETVIRSLQDLALPVLLCGRDSPDSSLPAVCCDNRRGGALAAAFLADAGRQRFAYAGKDKRTSANVERLLGFTAELERRGLGPTAETGGDGSYDSGRLAARRLLSLAQPPDAIFCFNDVIAFGVLQGVADVGGRPGADVAVVGFDDVPMAAWAAFDLTTVGYSVDELMTAVTGRLIAALDRGAEQTGSLHIAPRLVVRGSARTRQPAG